MFHKKTISFLFGLLFFSLPFSIPFSLFTESSYIFGRFSVWTTYFLQFQDLILLSILFISGILFLKKKTLQAHSLPNTFIILLFLSFIPLFFADDLFLHFFNILHLFFILSIFGIWKLFALSWNSVGKYFLWSMSFVSLIAITQFLLQHHLGFSFLGEPVLSANTLGVAKINSENETLIRAYGTFFHPNILAFFSVVSFFIAHKLKFHSWKWLFILPLILSFSRAAWLGFIISYFIFLQPWKNHINKKHFFALISLAFGISIWLFEALISRFNVFGSALSERIDGIYSALLMFFHYPFGVGFQQFTLHIQEFSSQVLFPWAAQAVHNTYLIIINEGGLFFFLFLLWITKNTWIQSNKIHQAILIFIAIVSLFDHYLWTHPQAQFLFLSFLLLEDRKAK